MNNPLLLVCLHLYVAACNVERACVYTALTFCLNLILEENGVGEVECPKLAALQLSISSLTQIPVGLAFGFVTEHVPLR